MVVEDLGAGQCCHTPLILAVGKQRQTDLGLRAVRATQKKTERGEGY